MSLQPPAVAGHAVQQLGQVHLPAICDLFDACAPFFRLIHGDTPHQEAANLLTDLPPGKGLDDKLVLGVFSAQPPGALLGVIELVRGYPGPQDWCLGLLLIHPRHRGQGLGAAICRSLQAWVRAAGGRTLRIVVQAQNPDALRFWQRQGYQVQARKDQQAAAGTNATYHLVLAL